MPRSHALFETILVACRRHSVLVPRRSETNSRVKTVVVDPHVLIGCRSLVGQARGRCPASNNGDQVVVSEIRRGRSKSRQITKKLELRLTGSAAAAVMAVATALVILAAVAVLTLVAAVEQLLDRLQQLGDFLHHVSVAAAVLRALALTVAEKGAKRANTHRHVCVSCIAGGTPLPVPACA
jgi:hypothetical protein